MQATFWLFAWLKNRPYKSLVSFWTTLSVYKFHSWLGKISHEYIHCFKSSLTTTSALYRLTFSSFIFSFSFPHYVFTREISVVGVERFLRQLFIPCLTKRLNAKLWLIYTLSDGCIPSVGDASWGYWVKFLQHVGISWCQNTTSSRVTLFLLLQLGYSSNPGLSASSNRKWCHDDNIQKGGLEVDGAAVQSPPPPPSILPSESRVTTLWENSHYCPKGCWENNGCMLRAIAVTHTPTVDGWTTNTCPLGKGKARHTGAYFHVLPPYSSFHCFLHLSCIKCCQTVSPYWMLRCGPDCWLIYLSLSPSSCLQNGQSYTLYYISFLRSDDCICDSKIIIIIKTSKHHKRLFATELMGKSHWLFVEGTS